MRCLCLAALAFCLCAFAPPTAAAPPGTVVVACKNFTEQVIMGEMLAILAEEQAGLKVERKLNLGGSHICWAAIQQREVDLYPEYTGTALAAILKAPLDPDAARVYRTVRQEFLVRWNLVLMKPLAFNNTYTLTVTGDRARALGVRTISDLVKHAPGLRLGCTHEFVERPDGLPGLQKTYGIRFDSVQTLDPGLTYTAVREGRVDVCDAYMTDGRIKAYGLQVLEDDRRFFPPYQVAPVARADTLEAYPALQPALEKLAGLVTDDEMREMNYAVDEQKRAPEDVARGFLAARGLARPPAGAATEVSSKAGLCAYMWGKRAYLAELTGRHLGLTGSAVLLAVLAGVPVGILLSRRPRLAPGVMTVINVIQTIPSLALLGFMVPLLGIGRGPAVVALFLYALLPIVRNTFAGLRGVEPSYVDAARGLGMYPRQVLLMVELPLALPVIMAGVRTSTVINIGTATLAALIGGGGLGEPIFRGIAMVDSNVILSGAIPAALLALAADLILSRVERWLTPRQKPRLASHRAV